MKEREFWDHLEYRLCAELKEMPREEVRNYWCDGFISDGFAERDGCSIITGSVWICAGASDQESWQFTLLLPTGMRNKETTVWSELLPDDDMTGWLSCDLEKKSMQIDLKNVI